MYKTNVQEIYKLPTDKKERERLSVQHQIWNILFGGLNAPALHETINSRMAVRDGPPPAVLDVGCGSASWAIEMASVYLQAQILGVDLAIDPSLHYAAPNVQFKQLDITHGFPPTPGGYTIIHARVVTGHLKDPTAFVQAAFAELKPGGLLILADVFKPIWADKSIPVPLFPGVHDPENLPPGGSWWAGWIDFWHRACYVDYRTTESLINAHDGLSVVHQERYLVPMHPSNDTEEREGLGAVSNSITLGFCHAGIKPFVATGQFTRTQVEEWIRLIQREFETKPIYMAWDIACGVKSS
ncbi:S-adenosyl-L-methionine-dependent methyltransferase [Mycena albidolilacea]|uniref:S-adenosyl-L-methionine-dependent methyltransferase n=1 Tax=Mycena albidolilacea TaxID=1033008 RepID=A0AAD7ADP1_9AGAR|nr:S-adenosyl-L-methionine-dependent methyltransferase [Mycena albidolilacea]